MSRYNQYGSNYYDPVGSQAQQPAGYTYQTSGSSSAYPSSATASGYGSNYQNYGANAYSNQQYGTSAGQQASSSTSNAAAALSSLSNQEYGQASSANRTSSTGQYDNSNYSLGTSSNAYGSSTNNLSLPNRTQSNNSPLYSSAQSSSTFGRLSVPEQTQSSSNTFGGSHTYQNAPSNASAGARSYQSSHTQQQAQPPRYNSPLHAVQAQQHGHNKQVSRGSNHQPSPQMAQAVRSGQQNRQQSASVEPSPTTVDPSQVYDNRAELQRQAQIEAERRRKREAEQAAKKAEEERLAEEKRKAEEEKQKAEKEAAMKKAEQDRKNEQRRKAREEKKQSKNAASALQRMASGGADASAAPPANDEEEEMRAMFQKMREFNAKNPSMLAKLWDEERKSHEATRSSASPSASRAPAQATAPSAASPPHVAAMPPPHQGGIRPFTKPAQPKAPKPTPTASQKTPQQTPAQQAQASPAQATTSLWPPHKKGALAEATAKWLLSLPQNAGNSITPQAVLNILNSNPSYVQLCESLESFGVKFERSTLARELLKAVPDGLKMQPAAKPTTPLAGVASTAAQLNGAAKEPAGTPKQGKPKKDEAARRASASGATPGSSTVNYEAPLSLSDAAREVNSMDKPGFAPANAYVGSYQQAQTQQSPYFAQPQPATNGSRPPSQSQPPEVKEELKPEEPPRPPADKEEAARKRTFGDLVDLTAEDSDDEAPPPKKVFQPPPSGPVNGVNNTQHRDPLAYLQKPTEFKQYMYVPQNQLNAMNAIGQGSMMPPRPPTAQMLAPTISSGHPQLSGMPPPLQQQQQAPPQPPQPIKPKGPNREAIQRQRMRGKMLVEPIMRDRVARKSNYDSRTIARDVLLATGRHPDMRGLNGHLAVMHKLLGEKGGEIDSGGNRSDLSTIKWDIIDPEPPKESKPIADGDKDELTEAGPPPTPRTAAARQQSETTIVDHESPDRQVLEAPPKKKLGRPRKSDYNYPGEAGQEAPAKKKKGPKPRSSMPEQGSLTNGLGDASTSTPARQTSTSRNATPSSAPAPAPANMSGAIGYAAFQQVGPDGVKKKGRPFGWRKEVHSREAQGLEPKTNPHKKPSSASKGVPGRPKAQNPASQSHEPVQPHYQVYRCEWEGCKSELHNLDTLKKHVVKIHGRKGDGDGVAPAYECGWEGCFTKGQMRWEGIEGWMQHVDTRHLQPIAWKLGDGPRSDFYLRDDSETPGYLTDSYGRSVTPIISPKPPITMPATAPAITLTQHGTPNQPPQDDAPSPMVPRGRGRPPKDGIPKSQREPQGGQVDVELRKLEEHKRIIGPTMDREGCVLVDEQRRKTFLDDEDFEDTGWGSEHDLADE